MSSGLGDCNSEPSKHGLLLGAQKSREKVLGNFSSELVETQRLVQGHKAGQSGLEGRGGACGVACARGPACLCASPAARLPAISIPMAPGTLCPPPEAVWGWGGMGAGHHKSTCCVCGWGGRVVVGGMGDGARFIAVVLEARLGLRQRQKRGEHVPPQRLSCPRLRPCPGFRELGRRRPPPIAGGPAAIQMQVQRSREQPDFKSR